VVAAGASNVSGLFISARQTAASSVAKRPAAPASPGSGEIPATVPGIDARQARTRKMTMTDAASEAKRQSLRDAFDFATKHFAVLSVAITVFGATMAIIFIAAYLRVFDWRIIWIIEYADVLKVGLIVVAVFSGFSYYIWSSTRHAIDLATQRGRSWLWPWLFGLLAWCISLGAFLYAGYHSTEPHYELYLFLHLAILALIALFVLPMNMAKDFPNFTPHQVAWLLFVLVGNVSTLGTAFGYYTRDTSGFSHDIFLKKGELHEVGLVMLTSHHVVLYTKQKTVIVIPSDDVMRMEAKKAN
jgi:hypothetical protein